MRPFGDPKTLEKRRLKAVKLLKKGLFPGEIAGRLGVDRRSVHRWLRAYRDQGTDGLSPVPASGRPLKLKAHDREKLTRMLLQGATAFGYPTDLWTSPRVADLIRRRFRVKYHPHHISRLLRSLGFSPQKPERRARERDEAAIRGWVRTQWPRLKKRLAAESLSRFSGRERASHGPEGPPDLGSRGKDARPLSTGALP